MADAGVWEAARCVRPYLDELLWGEIAAEVDGKLSQLLNSGGTGKDVEAELRAELQAHDATKEFLARVLEDAPFYRPPMLPDQNKGFTALPGDGQPVGAEKYACPKGDYVWYLPEVGAEIRSCRTHHLVLEPA